jgi:hypothetical protein
LLPALAHGIILAMKLSQRIIGWGVVALGAALVFVGASPLFAAIHWEGVFIGLGGFVGGAWLLAGPELRATMKKGLKVMRESAGTARNRVRRRSAAATGIDPLLPVRILKLARDKGGILSVADVAMGLEVPLDHAEAGLAECVRAGNALPDYDIARAHAVYRFPEFLPPEPPRLSR